MADVRLTPQQAQAVTNRGGSLLVSAAAGSGKTKVLVERVFSYLTEEHCHIEYRPADQSNAGISI